MLTKKGIVKEAERRKIEVKPLIITDGTFPQQDAFVLDSARYLAAQCSRRAGKSNGLAKRFWKTMDRHPGCQCIYIGLTRESAKEIMVEPMERIAEELKIPYTYTESNITFKHANGSTLKLVGADGKNFIRKLKGRKYAGVGIDEAQDFGAHIESLVDDVLTPATLDYEDGWIALTGTPGPVPSGYFFEVTSKGKYNFKVHKWTLLDNPHVPDPEAFIADLVIRKSWEQNSPTLLREYRNQWVLDVESLWVRYKEHVNDYKDLPQGKLNYILGVDIGYRDADALAVIGWSDASPVTYLIEEIVTKKQDITGLVEQIEDIRKRYDIQKIVMDAGGLGKKIAEEIIRRHLIPVEAADKMRKQENVELLNDALRTGKFRAKAKSQFALDSYLVQIDWDKSTPDRIVIKKKPHSDIIDAVLYAFKESYAYTHTPEKQKPRYGSKEWAEAQTSQMFEAELEGLQQENSEYNRLYGINED